MAKLGMCYTVMTAENKMIAEAAQKRGVELERIVDGDEVLDLVGQPHGELDVILQRSLSYSRGLYLAYYYEKLGVQVVNGYDASRICGDKMLCSTAMAKAGIPTPKTFVAFSPEAAERCAEKMGFPLVMKPVMGSWARMVHKINDQVALEAEIESREEMGNAWQKIYYMQEHVDKPGRDIRAVVVGDEVIAAIYRTATSKSGWVTNTSRGGVATKCEITPELRELCLKAAAVVGNGIYGVDLMESGSGLVVHEINHTIEFRNSISTTGTDIPGKMIEYALSCAKK